MWEDEDQIANLLTRLLQECVEENPTPTDLVEGKVWEEYRKKVVDCVRNKRTKYSK